MLFIKVWKYIYIYICFQQLPIFFNVTTLHVILSYSIKIFIHFKLWIATVIHSLKWLKITQIYNIESPFLRYKTFSHF